MRRVKTFIEGNPMLWKGFISGILYCASDFVTQKFVEKREKVDMVRNRNFLILGLGWAAPVMEIWYSKLLPFITERYIKNNRLITNPRMHLFIRLCVDMLVYPTFTFAGFYVLKSLLEKGEEASLEEVKSQVWHKLPKTLVVDWSVWIPVNYINFKYIPVGYQSLYVGIFNFIFNVIFSFVAFQQIKQEENLNP